MGRPQRDPGDPLGLRKNHERTVGGEEQRSCPSCSVQKGALVWHPIERFTERKTQNQTIVLQSWCGRCRSQYSKAQKRQKKGA